MLQSKRAKLMADKATTNLEPITEQKYFNCKKKKFSAFKSTSTRKVEEWLNTQTQSNIVKELWPSIQLQTLTKENILTENSNKSIISKYGNVWEYGKDFEMLDFKTNIKNVVKSKLGFKSTKQKMFTYTKGDKLVGISSSYEATPTRIQVLKRGANLENLNDVLKLAQINHVKEPKQNDIRSLMKYFTIPEEAKEFYNDIFKPNIDEINNDLEDENGVYSDDTH